MGTFAKIYIFFFAKEPIKIHQNSSLIISSEPITFIPRRKKKKNECERKITLREKIRIKVVSLFHRKKIVHRYLAFQHRFKLLFTTIRMQNQYSDRNTSTSSCVFLRQMHINCFVVNINTSILT